MTAASRASSLIRVLSLAVMAAMVGISVFIYHVHIPELAVFAFFAVCYMQLPGLLIVRLLKIRTRHISEDLLISFFAGWALMVALYFLCELIGSNLLLYISGPVCSAAYIWLLYTKRAGAAVLGKLSLRRIPAAMYAAAAILMTYVFLNSQFLYLSPELCDEVFAGIDKVYQMGLSMSLTHGYPLQSPWVHGVIEYYHLFTQILLAVPVMLFGLTPDFLAMSCSPYMTTYLVGLSFYAMFRHFCSDGKRAGLYTLSVILSNMFISKTHTTSYMFTILFANANHGGFGIAALMCCAIMLDICLRDDSGDKHTTARNTAMLTVLVMLLTGIKAPVGLVFAGGITGTFLLGLLMRSPVLKKAAVPTIASDAGFLATYMFLFSGDPTSGATNDSLFYFGGMTNITWWKEDLIIALRSVGVPGPVRLLCILAVFAIFFFTIYLLPFAIGYLREFILVVTKKHGFDFARITVYASALVGFVLMMFLSYDGHSQVYFGTATTAFAPLIAFWFFEEREEMTSRTVRVLYKACCIWFFTLIFVTSATLFIDMHGLIPAARYHTHPEAPYNPGTSLTRDEYNATKWLKENTPEDSLIATQMYMSVGVSDFDYTDRWDCCHFVYAAYSDRMFYLEGSGFTLETYETDLRRKMIETNNKLYDANNKDRGDLARSLGIDYVMVTKKIFPETPDLSSEDYEPVFTNNDIVIYKVSQAD